MRKNRRSAATRLGRMLLVLTTLLLTSPNILAQIPDITTGQRPQQPEVVDETVQTMFPHFKEGRFWVSGQANAIYQTHPPFHADYSGPNSLKPDYEKAISHIVTLYTGFQFSKSGEILLDFEHAGGLGLSGTFGVAGFPNLDATRDPTLGQAPYLSRVMVHQVIALSSETSEMDRGPLSTFSELPSRRLELRAGKFSIVDFFDVNSVGSDSHLQFMNWSVDQNGAYDFTADSRGYTWGVLAEYQSHRWGARFSEALLPKGKGLDWNLRKSNTSNTEFEWHRAFLPKRTGIIRVLSYVNNANMGIYRYANEQYLEGKVTKPDITAHPFQVTTKYGFGVNLEQSLTPDIVVFGRFGWSNGKTETWSFTEIDQTTGGGMGFLGHLWKRRYDRVGIAIITNGLSRDHALYLSYGGLGSVLGDGGLRYGRENILESYYTAHVWRGIFAGPDLQYVANPGFNQARGPVIVPAFRLHLEL